MRSLIGCGLMMYLVHLHGVCYREYTTGARLSQRSVLRSVEDLWRRTVGLVRESRYGIPVFILRSVYCVEDVYTI